MKLTKQEFLNLTFKQFWVRVSNCLQREKEAAWPFAVLAAFIKGNVGVEVDVERILPGFVAPFPVMMDEDYVQEQWDRVVKMTKANNGRQC